MGNKYLYAQLDEAEKRLRDSELKLARLRGQTNHTTKSDADDGIVAVKTERRSISPIDRNNERFSKNNNHQSNKPQLVIPAVTPKTSHLSKSNPKASASEISTPSVHIPSVNGGNSDKSRRDKQNLEVKDKGTKRKFGKT